MKNRTLIALTLLIGLGLSEIWRPALAWAVEYMTHAQVMARVSLRF